MTGIVSDLAEALRRLRASPIFTIFAIVTLALAIGVTTAVYSLIRTGLKPFVAIEGADRLMVVTDTTYRTPRAASMSWLDYQDVASQVHAFDAVVAWRPFTHAVAADGRAEFVAGEFVSGNFFDVVGARAIRGRVLQPSDDAPDAAAVAVISASAWRRYLNSDPAVLGRTVKLSGQPLQIVGIMPEHFRGIDRPRNIERPEIWLPLSAARRLRSPFSRMDPGRRDHQWLAVAGRIGAGTSRETATVAVREVVARLDRLEPLPPLEGLGGGRMERPRRWEARGVNDPIDFSEERAIFRAILLLPTLVLLVACTNLANFSLSRGISRQNELAVRQAIGASRWQLIRGQMVEYGLVALGGAVGGLLVAKGLLILVATTIRNIWGTAPQYRLEGDVDAAVLAAVGGAALLSVVVAGLLPALRLTGRGLARSIAADQASTSLPRWRGRGNLIALQISVSVALLLVSALCVRELPKIARSDSGLRLDRVGSVVVPFTEQATPDDGVRRILTAIDQQAPTLAGATSVAYITSTRVATGEAIAPAGIPIREGPAQPRASVQSSSPGYFATVGLSLLSGRSFNDADAAGAEPVAIINASLARRLFGQAPAVGQRLTSSNEIRAAWFKEPATVEVTIVGIVSDIRDRRGQASHTVYRPFAQRLEKLAPVELLARARDDVDPGALAHQLRDVLGRVNPDIAVTFTGRADVQSFGQDTALRLFTIWFGTLAFLALAFSMSGLYGVLSHVVALRTRELGVRAALGADRGRLIKLVLRDGARPVAEGIVIGLGLAAGARLGMQPWFEDPVTAVDPVAIVIALVPLVGAAFIACYLPARRAARVDPNVALRHL